jgi:hypothetical protein
MKKVFSFAALGIALLFATTAFAGDKSVTLSAPTTINGQKLAAGEYKVKYQVNGSVADVHFLQGKKEVASTSAQVVEIASAPRSDSVVTFHNGDGSTKLVELQFANQKSAIRFGSESSGGN